MTVLGYMGTSITTDFEDFKAITGLICVIFNLNCHYAFLGFGGSPGEKTLENKAFSHAGAAEVGEFTPNMG